MMQHVKQNSNYFYQVELLLKVIPYIMEDSRFALKGGTAINLFLRDMPRLSVDIDLTYTLIESRQDTFCYFNEKFPRLIKFIEQQLPEVHGYPERTQEGNIVRLIFHNQKIQIKVDINSILRGYVNPCLELELCKKAQEQFSTYTSVKCMSFEDIYAGKICAALDRQHPRDLFDIKILLENEGYSELLKKTFIVYLVSNKRPISESLSPNRLDIKKVFESDFLGMNFWPVNYDELIDTREKLVKLVNEGLTNKERQFLISLKRGNPDWSLVDIPRIDELPSVRWKLLNIQKMPEEKRSKAIQKLEEVLSSGI